jgi:hypothetical protein
MTNDLQSWVSEYDEEYHNIKKNNKLMWIIGFNIVIIGSSFLLIILSVESLEKFYNVAATIFFIGIFIFMILYLKNRKIDNYNKYLASMIYLIGYNLEKNSDTQSAIYIKKMDNYIKNCDQIIKIINNSLSESIYVKNTSSYIKKINESIKLLNEFYINYQKYDIDKADIAQQIIQLVSSQPYNVSKYAINTLYNQTL